jgi:hypothetical protein
MHPCQSDQVLQSSAKANALYFKAIEIQQCKARGLWMPIIWHLALRRHGEAMIELAAWFSQSNRLCDLGAVSDGFSAAGLYHRAWRAGDARAAQHMALGCFNRKDLAGYRRWLRRAANCGDGEAAMQLKWFQTRLWHGVARNIGRGRPYARYDERARLAQVDPT